MHALGFQDWYDSGKWKFRWHNLTDGQNEANMSPQQTPRVAWQAKNKAMKSKNKTIT